MSFSKSLGTKWLFLNEKLCVVRPTLIDMNPVKLKYYQFMISLNKYTGSSTAFSPKMCVPKEAKDINVKAFNIMRNKNQAKAMAKHISYDCKCNFNSVSSNSKQKRNSNTCQCEYRNYHKCKKDYSWNPSRCICENSKYLKSIADTSATDCDETIIVIDNVSTKKTNTIATKKTNTRTTDITSTASINCHSKTVRDCYILHTVLLGIILLLIIIIICYHYPKQKKYNIKWEIMNLKSFILKIVRVIISMA